MHPAPGPVQDINIPAPAAALYKLLAALFDYINEQIEPRYIGVVTKQKFEILVTQLGMVGEFADILKMSPEDLAQTYEDVECQYYVVPAAAAGGIHDYSYSEPDEPGLTKAGYIKLQALNLILGPGLGGPAKDLQYRFLQACIRTLPLSHIDGTTNTQIAFPLLPPQNVVSWYASSLATSLLGISDPTPTGVTAQMMAKKQERINKKHEEGQTQQQPQQADAERQQLRLLEEQLQRKQMYEIQTMNMQMAQDSIRRAAWSAAQMNQI